MPAARSWRRGRRCRATLWSTWSASSAARPSWGSRGCLVRGVDPDSWARRPCPGLVGIERCRWRSPAWCGPGRAAGGGGGRGRRRREVADVAGIEPFAAVAVVEVVTVEPSEPSEPRTEPNRQPGRGLDGRGEDRPPTRHDPAGVLRVEPGEPAPERLPVRGGPCLSTTDRPGRAAGRAAPAAPSPWNPPIKSHDLVQVGLGRIPVENLHGLDVGRTKSPTVL